jgi:uncharacterized protein YndB with AHSA1/START domain
VDDAVATAADIMEVFMAAHERSLEANAPPERVWSIWSDPSTWPRWNPDVVSIHLDGRFATGATGTMTTKAGGTHAIRLSGVEEGRAFQLETAPVPLTRFTFRCTVSPVGDQRSRISQSVTMGGPLGPLFSAMMGRRVADGFGPLLRGLAAAAAGDGAR